MGGRGEDGRVRRLWMFPFALVLFALLVVVPFWLLGLFRAGQLLRTQDDVHTAQTEADRWLYEMGWTWQPGAVCNPIPDDDWWTCQAAVRGVVLVLACRPGEGCVAQGTVPLDPTEGAP